MLLPILKNAFNRGIKITFLIYGFSKVDFGEVFHHDIELVRGFEDLGHTIDCVVDSSCCITGSLGKSDDKCQVVWTQNKGLVKSIEEYIIHDFYIAELQNTFGDSITKKFGKNLSFIRKKYGR